MFSTETLKVPEAVKARVDVATQAIRSYHTELHAAVQEMVLRQQEQLEASKRRAEALLGAVELDSLRTRGSELYGRVGATTAELQGLIQEQLGRIMALMRSKADGKAEKATKTARKAKKATKKAENTARKAKKATKKTVKKAATKARKSAKKRVKKPTRKTTEKASKK